MELIKSHRELDVYKLAFKAAMEIFNLTKTFPKKERYSLTDQIRRASRSVCSNIAEGWRKRIYKAAFIAKLSDAEAEACETQTWLDFSISCKYIDKDTYKSLNEIFDKIIGKLVRMRTNPEKWTIK
jgi:four helix bundle protein